MGIFKGIRPKSREEFTLRDSGAYEFSLVEVQAGQVNSQFSEEPKPALRFIFQDDEGKLSALANIPSLTRLPSGEYGLAWNEKSKFWQIVGALWGKVIGPDDASLLDMDIPGVSSPGDLGNLPIFFLEGHQPVTGVKILMGEEDVSAPGRPVLLTIAKKQGRDREMNVITGYSPVPRKKSAKTTNPLW